LPFALDGKDGNGLKFEKKMPVFSNNYFDATSSKILKKFIMVSPL